MYCGAARGTAMIFLYALPTEVAAARNFGTATTAFGVPARSDSGLLRCWKGGGKAKRLGGGQPFPSRFALCDSIRADR